MLLARRTGLSRRQAEEWIREGRILVDGEVARLGCKVDPQRNRILVEGRPLDPDPGRRTWVMLHKPLRVVTTRRDESGRPTVMDLLQSDHSHLFPVGRLDMMTTGLLLLTDDGELANGLLHPRRAIPKTYRLTLDVEVTPREMRRIREGGIVLDGRPVQPCRFRRVSGLRYEITITEGRNRQVRRMLAELGREVLRLHRIRFGPLELGDLEPGRHRLLGATEIDALARAAGGEG